VGVFLSRDRIEVLVETVELLGKEDFQAALEAHESGRMKTWRVEEWKRP
jgi:hypothetical protein